MALTTHEKIRTESGFQRVFTREPFLNTPDGSRSIFFVDSDDRVKFVPNLGTGATIATISDIQVTLGLSGVYGTSTLGVSAIDIDQGSVQLNCIPVSGSSLVISYASSPIASRDLEDVRLRAEAIVNQRLAICYDLPLNPTPSSITDLATRLGAALLLMRDYGALHDGSAKDGYALYDVIMGNKDRDIPGEISLICSPNYQLVDDNGGVILRNDSDNIEDAINYTEGGHNPGRLYDITEENFRFKEPQIDANTRQAGSADKSSYDVQ